MELIVIIICLAILYWTNVARTLRSVAVLSTCLRLSHGLLERCKIRNGIVCYVLIVAASVVIVAAIFCALFFFWSGILAYVFSALVLLYCLGDLKFSQDASAEENLSAALQDIFSVIFWFALLGPVGAIVYRVTERLQAENPQTRLTQVSSVVLSVLDWVPARLLAFCFALVGHFTAVVGPWLRYVFNDLKSNMIILSQCAESAFKKDKASGKDGETAKRDYTVGLIYRSLIVWLVVIGLIFLL